MQLLLQPEAACIPRQSHCLPHLPGLLSQPFKHKENNYDEYKDQVLLPHMFTRSGPFVATGDVNKDGAA